MLNLVNDPWLPVRCRSGRLLYIAPWQITQSRWPMPVNPQKSQPRGQLNTTQSPPSATKPTDSDLDPVVAISSPRPDFDGALTQFLIGLFQSCFFLTAEPLTRKQWGQWMLDSPKPAALKTHLQNYAPFFEATHFMQDYEMRHKTQTTPSNKKNKSDSKPIAQLLISTPGDETERKNTDHFIKRHEAGPLCVKCTMMALLTLQTNAPSGGQGHRTSLRGGGPLTTLAVHPAISKTTGNLKSQEKTSSPHAWG